MPKFTVSVHVRQTLVDSEVVTIEAETLQDAIDAAELLAGADRDEVELPDGVFIPEDDAVRLRTMDPHQICDGETEVTEGDYTQAHLKPTPDPLGFEEGQDRVPGGAA